MKGITIRKILIIASLAFLVLHCGTPLVNTAAQPLQHFSFRHQRETLPSTPAIGPPPCWNQTYGGYSADSLFGMVECSGGGFVFVGSSNIEGSYDVWLVRTDADGTLLWNKSYGGGGSEGGFTIIEVDGGFAVAGYSNSFSGNYDAWLIRIDLDGNHLWNVTYDTGSKDQGFGLVSCTGGGFAICGLTDSVMGAGATDAWLIRTDDSGNHLWNNTFGGANSDYGYDLIECACGGFVIIGSYTPSVNYDAWLIHTDSTGHHLWNQTYGDSNHDQGFSLIQCSSGGYAIAGSTYSYGVSQSAAWFIRTDHSGTHLWNKTYDGFGYDSARDVIELSDGGFAIAGYLQHSPWPRAPQPCDGLLVRTDSSGNQLWNSTYGRDGITDQDRYYCLVEDSSGNIFTAGSTNSYGAGGDDGWLVKTLYPLYWYPAPTDQTLASFTSLSYYMTASSWFDIDKWKVNDTTGFAISSTGILSFANPLSVGTYGLRVSVTDVLGNEISGEFSITIYQFDWNPAPTDQTVPYEDTLSYDLNVNSTYNVDTWTINDTTHFIISSTGVVSNATVLSPGVYGLRVTVADTMGEEISGEFTVTVQEAPLPEPILVPFTWFIGVVATLIVVDILVLLLLYFFVLRKRK